MGDEQPTDRPAPGFVPVCAIGASAGGVTALQTLFRLLPDDLGLAYVVVVHLSPDHPSAMHEILGAATRMPVFQVSEGPTLQANCVYVIAPDRELVIEGDDVKSRPFTDPRGRRAPIDMFFRSIASGRGDGIAVVLTGAGSDGALGVRAIKEAGGIVMVQEPAEAGFPSMPQNAIATGVADVVAPLSRLAERIAEAAQSKEAVRSLEGDGSANDVRRIVAFLRTRTGHDFSGYKRSTVLRRISRRMQVCQILSLSDYAKYLRGNPEEAKELLADLLISVTMFFRDPGAYVSLGHQAVRPLLERWSASEDGGEFRAWVVGCATGEEAYSLAILLLEEAEQLKLHVPIQIFATDLDEGALATAREGRYPRTIEADVSAERLKRFFVDEGTHYRISQHVRDLVLFATHSVVREPPFMRLDLISCRNVLIYLERTLQQHVCSIFHYGLKPDGYLFLGTAETADASQSQFAPVDRDARIYRATRSTEPALPAILSTSIAGASRPSSPAGQGAAARFDAGEILGASHASALEASAPPSALVDADHTVLHLSPTAGRFILLSAGPLTGRLPGIVRPELRLDLKLALDRVFDTGQPTITRLIDVAVEGSVRRMSLHIVPAPIRGGSSPRAVVYFLDNGPARPADEQEPAPPFDELRHLHSELKMAQEAELAGRVRHESAVQELRASNEELQSLNEEYRSTAEELETSKEELQSINEELQTVNAELKSKLGVISAAHNDLQNLTASSEIGTLFLDSDLRIRMFTPRVAELINVAEADVGRPITNFTHRLDYDDIAGDVRRVLRELSPLETEVRTVDGRWFVVRIRPYRTLDGKVEGAVVTFDDNTDRMLAREALSESEAKYRGLFQSIDEGFCVVEIIRDEHDRPVDMRYLEVNDIFEQQTGLHDAAGKTHADLGLQTEQRWFERYGEVARTGVATRFESFHEPTGRWYDVFVSPSGAPSADRVVLVFNDTTERRRMEQSLRESSSHLARELANSKQLQAVSSLLIEGDGDEALYGRILDAAMAIMRADFASLQRFDTAAGELVLLGHRNFHPDSAKAWHRISYNTGTPCGGALNDADRLFVTDCATYDPEGAEWFRLSGIGSCQSTPLTARDGRLIGMMSTHWRTAHTPTEDDYRSFDVLVRQTADAFDRASADAALRESEERQAFLLELSDALRPLDTAQAIMQAATDLLRARVAASRCGYYEIEGDHYFVRSDSAASVPSLVGRYPIASFGSALHDRHLAGQSPIIVEDVARVHDAAEVDNFAAIQVAAYVSVTLVKQGRFVAGLTLHSREPRNWTAADIALAQETAERTWAAAERARAEATLRESEEEYRTLFTSMGQGYIEVELIRDASGRAIDYRYLRLNPAYERLTGVPAGQAVGHPSLDVIPDLSPFWVKTFEQGVAAREPQRFDYEEKALGRWYQVFTYPGIGDRLTVLAEDVTERKRVEAALRESEEQQRMTLELVPALLWWADPAGDKIVITERWGSYTGQSETEVQYFGWLDAIHPDDVEATRADFQYAFATGEPLERQHRIQKAGNGYRWHLVRHVPVRDASGTILRWFGAAIDVHELHELQDRQQVMVAELQHRTRNLIAVVRSLAQQTMAETESIEAFRSQFNDRLSALSRVQGLLSQAAEERITIGQLVRMELDALGAQEVSDRIVIDGPEARLRNSVVQTLALAIHELATNARKYGSLATEAGTLKVTWNVDQADGSGRRLVLEWLEEGIDRRREEQSPATGGYGRELIERALPYALNAKTSYQLDDHGVRCTIDLPLDRPSGSRKRT